MDINKYLVAILPITSVYLTSSLFPRNTADAGKKVWFRPPGYVFGIVWPILLALLGYSWYLRQDKGLEINLLYSGLVFLLSIWFILFTKNRYYGLINIILSIILSIILFNFKYQKNSSYALIPLICWLCFASLLNIEAIRVNR